MPARPIQASFSGGEFAPSVSARVDIAKYSTGAKTLLNFLVHPHGGASNRPGTKYVAAAKYPTKDCRLIAFSFSLSQSYILEVGDLYMRFFTQGGQINISAATAWSGATNYVVGDLASRLGVNYYCILAHINHQPPNATYWYPLTGTIYEIPTPYAEADIRALKYTQSADTLYIAHPSHTPMKLIRHDQTNWTLETHAFVNGPFKATNATATILRSSTAQWIGQTGQLDSASTPMFSSSSIGSLWELDHDLPSVTQSGSFGANGSSSTVIGMGGWRLITHGTWTGKLTVQKSNDNGSNWIEVRVFTSTADFNVNTFGADDNNGNAALYRLTMSGYVSGTCNYDFTIDASTVRGIVQVTSLVSVTNVNIVVIKPVGSVGYTTFWSQGSWGIVTGYPACVTFYQDRLTFANTTAEPQGLWFSKTSNYVDNGISEPLVDDDAIAIQLSSRQMNGINNLVPFNELLALTLSSEWSVGAGSGDPLTPTTISAKVQGFRGSSALDPVVIGNRMIYVQPMGTIVRDMGFEFSSDSFTGDNLSLISNHLFTNHEIVDMTYQQEPDSIVWAVREDGKLLSLTYLKEQQVLAWARHETKGTFEAVASIPNVNFNEVWFVVTRNNVKYIERMVERMVSEEPEDQFFVDCGLTYDGVPATTITGLSHLNGQTVSILADGIEVIGRVVSAGSVTIPVAASIVHVGLPYNCDLETLNPEITTPEGSSQGKKVRAARTIWKFLKSRGGYIGPDFDSLSSLNLEDENPITDKLALYTGDIKKPIGAGWETNGRVCYRQTSPLPVTVLAIIPELQVGG